MRRRALSNLGLAKALGEGVAHTTVGRWLEGSRPRGAVAKRLADYFEIPVEVLLDDSRGLPAEYSPPLDERVVNEAPPAERAEQQLEAVLAKKLEALDARIAALDSALVTHPAIAEAMDAGLTMADVRVLIRAEIARRRQTSQQTSPHEVKKAQEAKIAEIKARVGAAAGSHQTEEERRRHA